MSHSDTTAQGIRDDLYEAIRRDVPFERKAQEALELGRQYLGADNGHLTRIDRETDHWEVIASTDISEGRFHPGLELDLGTTYCRRTIESDSQIRLHDAPSQGWADDPAFEEHGLHCYHGTTLVVDDEPYGTVCFVADEPREQFSDGETLFAELVTRLLERELERERHESHLVRQTNLAAVLNRVLRHNLRNDLSVIRGYTARMAAESENGIYGQTVLSKVDTLIDLSEKARQLDRVVAADDEREAVNITERVGSVVESVAAEYPDATVTVDCDEDDVTVAVFPGFERAIEELVENAVKHGNDSPTVTVTVETVPNAVEITITDDGPGLADHEAEVLETGAETPLTHGSGLGLWLSHWIVTSHDGTIDAVETEDGTTMRVSIPRTVDPGVYQQLTRLTRARDQYLAAFEEANDAMVILNDEGRIIEANPEASNIYGLDSQDLLGQPFQRFLPEGFDFGKAWDDFRNAGRERDTVTIVGADDVERRVEYSAATDIVPGQHLVVSRDITERIRDARALEETTHRLEAIIQSCPDAMLGIDADGTISLWNDAAEEVFGYPAEAAIGESIESLAIHTPEQRTDFERQFERALDGETLNEYEVWRQTQDGERIRLSLSTAPVRDASGTVTSVIAIAKDITDQYGPDEDRRRPPVHLDSSESTRSRDES